MRDDDAQILFEKMAAFQRLADSLGTEILENLRERYSEMYFKAKAWGRESVPFMNEMSSKVDIIDKVLKKRKKK